MDIERALVSKVVFAGQIDKVISRNIRPDMFADDECRSVYRYILKFAHQYGTAPSLEAAKHDRPEFEWIQIQDTLDFLIDRFTVLVKRRMADDYLEELARACDDPTRAENIDAEFLEVARKLVTAIPSPEVARFSEVEKRIKEYEVRKKEGKKYGIPYGIPTLDRLTGGIQSHELVTVLGFTSVGKSTLLRALAFNFWLQNFTPLYLSLEMESSVILRILDAMAATLDYDKLKQLDLSEKEMKQWKRKAIEIKMRPCDIPVIDNTNFMTPDQVFAETIRHKPDIVIIDYVGLMRSSQVHRGISRYQQLSDITQDLKHIARTIRIPILMAAQTNRDGAKDGASLENVADAISIARDSDTVIGLFQDEEMEKCNEMQVRLNKNRDGRRGIIKAIWNYDTMEFREKTAKDMFQRK